MAKELADNTFDELVNFGTTEIVEQVLGGKKTLRSAIYWIIDVSVRWGKETEQRRQLQYELSKRRSRRQNKKG